MSKYKNFIIFFIFPLSIHFILHTTILRDLLILFNVSSDQIFIPAIGSNVICDIFIEGKINLFWNSIFLLFANSQWNVGIFYQLFFVFYYRLLRKQII